MLSITYKMNYLTAKTVKGFFCSQVFKCCFYCLLSSCRLCLCQVVLGTGFRNCLLCIIFLKADLIVFWKLVFAGIHYMHAMLRLSAGL